MSDRQSTDENPRETDHVNAPWEERMGCAGQTAWLAVIAIVVLVVLL